MVESTARPEKPSTPVAAVIAVTGVLVGVVVTVGAAGEGVVPTLVALGAGIASGARLGPVRLDRRRHRR